MKTRIRDKKTLASCLADMGYRVQDGGTLRGFEGRKEADLTAELPSGYNIGFVRGDDGNYEVVADWWGVRGVSERDFAQRLEAEFEVMERRIRHEYAVTSALTQLQQQGFNVVEQTRREDGTVKILARRWQ